MKKLITKILKTLFILLILFEIIVNSVFIWLKTMGAKIVLFHPGLPLIIENTAQMTYFYYILNLILLISTLIYIITKEKKNGRKENRI